MKCSRWVVMLALLVQLQVGVGQTPQSFFVIHCDPDYAHLFPQLIQLVNDANNHNILLTIQLSPQWVEAILADSLKLLRIRTWQAQGHEIAAHHHGIYHVFWDGYTNYPPDSIVAHGQSLNDYLGNMGQFRTKIDSVTGDSLTLTYGGPGPGDPFPEVDWMGGLPYRTSGGRRAMDAFSSPTQVTLGPHTIGDTTYGPYTVCQITYAFIGDQTMVDSIITLVNTLPNVEVVGVVTHVFNYAGNRTFVRNWMQFARQNTIPRTVRQILRNSNCQPILGVDSPQPTAADGFALYANYPNPFNPITYLGFRIADFGFVELKIYDVIGQAVKTLVQETLSPGRYEVQWDGTDEAGRPVASGVYFYRLSSGNYSLTRKMLLIR